MSPKVQAIEEELERVILEGLAERIAEALAALPTREQQEIVSGHLEAGRYEIHAAPDGWITVMVSEWPLVRVHFREL